MLNLGGKPVITIVVVAIVLFIVLNKLISKIIPDFVGIGKGTILDPDTNVKYSKTIDSLLASKMFDPSFYKQFPSVYLMPGSMADRLAKQIRDSWGMFNDDEDRIYDALNQAKSWSQVSQIADSYSRMYQENLLTTLKDSLSKTEVNYMWNLLKRKPRSL